MRMDRIELDRVVVDSAAEKPGEQAAPEAGEQDTTTTTTTLFSLVKKAGITVNPASSEQYLALMDDYGLELVRLAFEEAARQAKPAVPAYLQSICERCKRERCLPGEWPGANARASPRDDNNTHGVGPSARWG